MKELPYVRALEGIFPQYVEQNGVLFLVNIRIGIDSKSAGREYGPTWYLQDAAVELHSQHYQQKEEDRLAWINGRIRVETERQAVRIAHSLQLFALCNVHL